MAKRAPPLIFSQAKKINLAWLNRVSQARFFVGYTLSRHYSRALPLPYFSQVVASGVISTTSIDIESHLQPVVSLLFSPSYVQVITLYPLTLFDVLSKRIFFKNCVRVFFHLFCCGACETPGHPAPEKLK